MPSQEEEAKKLHQPADKLFKDAFRRKEVIIDFLQGRMSTDFLKKIDLATLKLENSSFVTEEMKEKESDVIWSVSVAGQRGYLFFLTEHQTKYDPQMPMRLISYNTCLQEQYCNNNKSKEKSVPIIINIVVYAGEKPYKGPRTLRECYAHPQMVDFMLDHTFLIDLHRDSKDRIFEDEKAALAQFLLREYKCKDFCEFFRKNPKIRDLVKESPYRKKASLYMLDREKHDKPAFLKNILKLDTNTQGEIMGELYKIRQEGMQEGRQEGRQEGMQQGMQQGKKEMLKELLSRGIVTFDQIKNLK